MMEPRDLRGGGIAGPALEETWDFVSAIEAARSEIEIIGQLLQQVRRWGATHVCMGMIPHPGVPKHDLLNFVLLSSWPEKWVERYIALDYVDHDPVKQRIKAGHAAFFWSEIGREPFADPVAQTIMNEAAEFGLREGFTLSLPLLEGGFAGFSIAGERLDLDPRAMRLTELVAACAFGRVVRLRKSRWSSSLMGISKREREAIQLVAEGLSEREIAQRMGISWHGVDKHLRSIREKLKAQNTVQAVAVLIRCGVIS